VTRKETLNWLKDMAPALAVLLLSLAGAFFYGDFAPLTKWKSDAWMVPFRFVRFAVILCLPILIVTKIYFFIIRKMAASLIQLDVKQDKKIKPFKHWLFRPMQGIGISLVFSIKLIAVLQLISGPSDGSSILIAESHYQFGRLAAVTLITAGVSILLSILWTFDDIGIRYYNKKDQELKMIGKYAGTVVPFVFGIYGILTLIANYPAGEAYLLVFKIAVVLYPPMLVFAVLHAYFVSNRTEMLLNNKLKKGRLYLK
jgi:hypothetical protein